MASSLGIYIDNDSVKYAKLQGAQGKEKIEAFGVKYGNVTKEMIQNIINETNSNDAQIVVNSMNTHFEKTQIFSMIKKKDYEMAVNLKYEQILDKNKLMKELLKYGFVLSQNIENAERLDVLLAYQELSTIETRANLFPKKENIYSQMPIEVAIANLSKENLPSIIVNIEDDTRITVLSDNTPKDAIKINNGIGPLIGKIQNVENSTVRSYEVLKNTVLPLDDMDKTTYENNEYLGIIVSEMTEIAQQIKKVITSYKNIHKKIYFTGTGAVINNIEMFMEKIIGNTVECIILKPFMVKDNSKAPIKEYIEVNSAIALALEALGYSRKYMAFKSDAQKGAFKEIKLTGLKNDFLTELNVEDQVMLRVIATLIIAILVYSLFAGHIRKENTKKINEVNSQISEQKKEIDKINKDTSGIDGKEQEYSNIIRRIETGKNLEKDSLSKESVPNLLTQIAHIIPNKATIVSITENNRKVKIVLESYEFEQLGYFIGKVRDQNILMNIITSKYNQKNGLITVEIEGELL